MNKTTYKGIYDKANNKTMIQETRRDFYGEIKQINIIGEYPGKPERNKTTDRRNFTLLKAGKEITIFDR